MGENHAADRAGHVALLCHREARAAFGGLYGITDVLLSADGGQTWAAATLGQDLGRYSFREWQTTAKLAAGEHVLKVRAVNRIGQSQPAQPLWNPAGYMRNVIESVRVMAA